MFRCLKDYLCGRPEVIVDFIFDHGLLHIMIKNIGRSPAHNARIEFDRQFRGLGGTKLMNEMALFRDIRFLPPAKTITTLVDSTYAYFQRQEPTELKVTIVYEDNTGKRFVDSLGHNLEIYRDIAFIPATTSNDE